MKRSLPKSIAIGGHRLKIQRKKNLLTEQNAYGTFDSVSLIITIDDSLSDTLAWETLWHEVVEAINFFSEADIEHKSIQVFGLLLHQAVNSIFTEKRPAKKGRDE